SFGPHVVGGGGEVRVEHGRGSCDSARILAVRGLPQEALQPPQITHHQARIELIQIPVVRDDSGGLLTQERTASRTHGGAGVVESPDAAVGCVVRPHGVHGGFQAYSGRVGGQVGQDLVGGSAVGAHLPAVHGQGDAAQEC